MAERKESKGEQVVEDEGLRGQNQLVSPSDLNSVRKRGRPRCGEALTAAGSWHWLQGVLA